MGRHVWPALVSLSVVLLAQAVCFADVTSATAVPTESSTPACVACVGDGAGRRSHYSDEEWKTLTAGEVLLSEVTDRGSGDIKQGRVRAAGIIPHPPARVWETLVDFPARPRFQPGTEEVHVVRTDGDRVWVAQHLRFFLVDVRFTIINTLDPASGTLSWVLDDSVLHDIAGTTGSWQLSPVEDGRHTLLVYQAWNDTGRYIPEFIEQSLLYRSLPKVISGVRDEVERRFGAR